jgi:hypothetical protein
MEEAAQPTPIADSYWVVPGRLLAGEYPGALEPELARERLRRFLASGVTSFVDLTRDDDGLEPYAGLMQEEARGLGLTASQRRFPIRDMDVPSSRLLRAILDAIDTALSTGHVVYVHCWGGLGRTGTVVGAWLVDHGMSGDQALTHIAKLRRDTPDGWKSSPQTEAQCALVREWRTARLGDDGP